MPVACMEYTQGENDRRSTAGAEPPFARIRRAVVARDALTTEV